MLSKEENEFLTRVGPGTPAGEMLRRYWWPVAFSDEVKPKGPPVKVTLLAEDFVLFRDGALGLGLVALHCSHRGTSLEFGRVEDRGIRCCYHGWLYDVRGNCLEQPAEPVDSTFKERIKHPAYHAQDAGGLIFAYVGPEPAPLLPNYDLLVRQDGCRVVGGGEEFCNWLQRAENSADGAHSIALHAAGYPNMAMKRPTIKWRIKAAHHAFYFSFARTPLCCASRRAPTPSGSFPRAEGRSYDQLLPHRFLSAQGRETD
jgi:5,5'-dehydrodivanillate O-demethylase oxygenase subunit